jgi:hypothetical protein
MLRAVSLSLIFMPILASCGTASQLLFQRKQHTVTLFSKDGKKLASFEACNNVVSGSDPFPVGTYKFSHAKRHEDDAAGSTYGRYGIVVFEVPSRTGLGIHSGRADAKNNPGPKHPTQGCIRTTDDAMKKILEVHVNDKLTEIKVVDD